MALFGITVRCIFWYNFGYTPEIIYVDHHTAHAASAYYISGFKDSLVVTFDGSGDNISCAAFRGKGASLEKLDAVLAPNSFGELASYITQYLGFRCGHDEYKVMGLASYGKSTLDLSPLMSFKDDRPIFDKKFLHPEALNSYPVFHTAQLPMFKDETYPFMPPRRLKDDPLLDKHKDLAASTQKLIEDGMLRYVKKHKVKTDTRLCLAGGVVENSVANGKIAASKLFKEIYIAPACSDAGTALGAALIVCVQHGFSFDRLENNKLGPHYSNEYIEQMLQNYQIPYHKSADVSDEVAGLLADQKIVAWFQGRLEFGPRALGARSLLADPSNIAMKNRVNRIKKREQFRPFAPSVLEEHAGELFEITQPSPFMSFTLETTEQGKKQIVAATHVDYTGRLQTVRDDSSPYRKLIEAFYRKTGVPAVLNTSLNSGWEPIVESPDQALAFFFSSEADVLVLHDFIVTKQQATSAPQNNAVLDVLLPKRAA